MRRLAWTLLLVTVVALVAASPSAAAGVWRASGSGVAADGGRFEFRVKLPLRRQQASGTMREEAVNGLIFVAPIRCVIVDRNRALLSGTITSGDDMVGKTMHLVIEDGGRTAPDRLESWFGGTEDPCAAPLFAFPQPPEILSGRITIKL